MSVARNEWESQKFTIVTGAGASTNFAVTGIAVGDKVQAIVNLTDLADVSLAGLAISAGNIQVTASTSAKKLLVVWIDRTATA